MTNFIDRAAEIASQLRDYTQRTIRVPDGEGGNVARRPSLRWIETQMNGDISHQRLSEFLRNPGGVTENMLNRIANVIDSPSLEQIWGGDRVTYYDAPAMTEARVGRLDALLTQLDVDPEALAFRLIVETDEESYNGFRSTGWSGDIANINAALDAAPGGRNAVTRIVFDTGAA